MKEAALMQVEKASLADKPVNANDYGDLYQRASKIPAGHSPELRGGVLYPNCHCTKRNGLQSDCGRFLCRGREECLTNPPMCIHSGGFGYI
jgi:hypothetical protein